MADLKTLSPQQLRDTLADLQYLSLGQRGDPRLLGDDSGLQSEAVPFWLDALDPNSDVPAFSAQPSLNGLFSGAPSTNRQRTIGQNLRDVLSKDPSLLSPTEKRAVESALIVTDHEGITLDGNLDAIELGFRAEYLTDFDAGVSAVDIAAENGAERQAALDAQAAAIAAQEAAAQAAEQAAQQAQLDQAQLEGQLTATLVMGGYLDLKKVDINNPQALAEARVLAMDALFQDNFEEIGPYKMADYFDPENGYAPKGIALERAMAMTEGAVMPVEELRRMLESENPQLITIAQHYMVREGKDVDISGLTDPKTSAAAQALLRDDIELPAGIRLADGKVDFGELITAVKHGQVSLPATQEDMLKYGLSADQVTYAMSIPSNTDSPEAHPSREQFIARVMIKDQPALYDSYLADLNVANDSAILEAKIVAPLVDVPTAEAQNPLGFTADGLGMKALVTDSGIDDGALGQNADGVAVFSSPDQGAYNFIAFLRNEIPANENGQQTISMYDVLTAHHEAILSKETDYLERNTAGDQWPSESEGRFMNDLLREKYGIEGEEFNLNDPKDIEMMLTGLNAYVADQESRLPVGEDQNYLVAYLNDPRFTDVIDSNIRVAAAGGIPPNPAEENTRLADDATPEAPAYEPTEDDINTMYAQTGGQSVDPLAATSLSVPGVNAPISFQSPVFAQTSVDCLTDKFNVFCAYDANARDAGVDMTGTANTNNATFNPNAGDAGVDIANTANGNGLAVDPKKVVTAGFTFGLGSN